MTFRVSHRQALKRARAAVLSAATNRLWELKVAASHVYGATSQPPAPYTSIV